jgi:hypothetical protein
LVRAQSAPAAETKSFAIGQRARLAEDLGVSQGDVRALGGQ